MPAVADLLGEGEGDRAARNNGSLIGDEAMVRDRIKAYRDCGITTLRVDPGGNMLAERLETLGRVVDIVRALDREAAAVGA